MSDALVSSIPAWSKDVDPLFASDSSLLFDSFPSATDFYSSRRMSDSALTVDTATTTDPNSPATEPDVPVASPPLDPARKPSLPGIGALTPLIDPSEAVNFTRRASLPTLAADLSLRSPASRPTPFRPSQLAPYSFPGTPGTPPLDSSYSALGSATSSVSSFPSPSPFASPLSSMDPLAPGSFPEPPSAHHQQQPQSWSPSLPTDAPPASPHGSPKRRRTPESASVHGAPAPAAPTCANPSAGAANPTGSVPDTQPARRPRGKLPKHTTDLLKEWLHAHSDHPYPSEDEKRDLCARTKLSMSQVSNWMINARRRILAPAKPPAVSATTTEPYRGMPRQISSLYPAPHVYPGMVRRPEGAIGIYDAGPYSPYDASPRYQAQPMYPVASAPERRLAYPASTVGYGHMADFAPQYGPSPLYLPGSSPQQRDAPRYFAAPSEPSL